MFEFSFLGMVIETIKASAVAFCVSLLKAVIVFYIGKWLIRKVSKLAIKLFDKKNLDPSIRSFLESMISVCLWLGLAIAIISILGIEAHNYGISGHQTKDIVGQAERAKEELGDKIDAFIIFIGTNDFERSVELGEWFEYSTQNTTIGGPITVARRYRTPSKAATYRGRINIMMDYLKTNFPEQQVILLTPIHRGFSEFSAGNIQPDEYFTNAIGLYIDDYVAVMKETANIWAVPVIDLNAVCGLYPMNEQFHRYFMNSEHDVLHPNTLGHKRMAYAIAYQLLGYPASFKY